MERIQSLLPLDRIHVPPAAHKLVTPLAVLGGLYAASSLRSFVSWTWLHLIRRGNVEKYKSANGETWALVTGASDGIGEGFTAELAHRGFNVIMHGRNEEKLEGVKDKLQRQFPQTKFRLFILDAEEDSGASGKMAEKVDELKDLDIRILVNNVAGGGKHEKPIFDSLQDRKPENINGWLSISCRFPAQLTRLMLPILIAKPSSLILNIGSGVGDMSVPYLAVYAGSKSFNKVFSRCLQAELRADGNDHVEVIAIIVGRVATPRMAEQGARQVTWDTPSPRQMAVSSLEAVGSGEDVIDAYWGHAVQTVILGWLPKSVSYNFGIRLSRQLKADERAGRSVE